MLRRFFLEDWRLKALSLAIAFAMYVFVNYETRSEVGFPVPVELANIPPWLTLTAQPPSAAYLRVVGPRTRIGAVDREELRFRIDLADAQEGVSTYNLNAGDLGLPGGIEARSVSPSSISLTLEATRRRVVPVNPAFSGFLPPGLVLAGIRVAPARAEVSGPASSVDAIEAAWTSRISLAGRTESFVETAALDFRGAQASA
ncbi:MAG: hypothetical protein K8I02_13655, partial [Candidatus Methylomirabilis sp.]|nr:hypothetical protein [Deltaproteobacteria bacterium]